MSECVELNGFKRTWEPSYLCSIRYHDKHPARSRLQHRLSQHVTMPPSPFLYLEGEKVENGLPSRHLRSQ